jgi:hypothetical protein
LLFEQLHNSYLEDISTNKQYKLPKKGQEREHEHLAKLDSDEQEDHTFMNWTFLPLSQWPIYVSL